MRITRELNFHGSLWQKISLKVEKGAHNWYRQHVNSHFVSDEPSISPLGAAVQLLFSLPPVWAFPSSHLGIPISAFFNWISFVFVPLFVFLFSDSMHLPSSSLGFPFPSFGAFPSPHLGLSIYCIFPLISYTGWAMGGHGRLA